MSLEDEFKTFKRYLKGSTAAIELAKQFENSIGASDFILEELRIHSGLGFRRFYSLVAWLMCSLVLQRLREISLNYNGTKMFIHLV